MNVHDQEAFHTVPSFFDAVAATGPSTTAGLTATFSKDADWGSGFQGTFTDRGYNATVPAGSSTSFGFIVAGTGAPTGCTVNGAPCAAGGVRSFTVAFVTAVGCKAAWFNAFDPRSGAFKDQIDAIRKQGGDVKISFGGATGQELAQACTDVNALQAG
jgi:hypothetical protein